MLWMSYIWSLGGIISAQTRMKGEKEEDSYKKIQNLEVTVCKI